MLATQFEAWKEQWLAEARPKEDHACDTFEAWKEQWLAEGEAKGSPCLRHNLRPGGSNGSPRARPREKRRERPRH